MPSWLQEQSQEVLRTLAAHVPRIGAALLVLVLGWIISLVFRSVTFSLLRRTAIDDRIAKALGMQTGGEYGTRVEAAVARTAYYVVLAVTLVVFFSVLGVDAITHPFLTVLNGLAAAVPHIVKAALLALAGFLAALLVRNVLTLLLDKVKLDKRFASLSGEEPADQPAKGKKAKRDLSPLDDPSRPSRRIANAAYWFVLAVAAVPVVEALQIGVLARPLSASLEAVTTFLPRIGAALVILGAGYLLARVVRAVASGALERIGLDGAVDRLGLGRLLGEQRLSRLVGTVLFAFILLQFAISAVGRLQIDEISRPASLVLEQVYAYLPKLLVGALLLAIGVAVARVIGNVVASLVAALGFNTLLAHIGITGAVSDEARAQEERAKQAVQQSVKAIEEEAVSEPGAIDEVVAAQRRLRTPSDVVGLVVSALVVLLFLRQALSTMQLEGLALMLDALIAYLPHVLAASLVLGAGLWAGRWAGQRVDELTAQSSDSLVRGLGRVVRAAIVVFTAMLALQQLGVGRELLALAFGLILGAACLALALAFGLGGREVAGKILAKAYERRQEPPRR